MSTKKTESGDIDAAIARLSADGAGFAVATVIRTLASTAARPGMKAVLMGDGEFAAGWLGGNCVASAVSQAAVEAVQSGEPRLVILRPEELLDDAQGGAETEAHVVFARNGCPSKGSLDIFVEPVTPLSELLIFGCGPVANALSRMAGDFGFRLVVCGSRMAPDMAGRADAVFDRVEDIPPAGDGVAGRYIVIATQGRGDRTALEAASVMPANYIGFVASRRKFGALTGKLLEAGIDKERLERIKAPAGVDIKAVTPEEIALSILAEIVRTRRDNAPLAVDQTDG